MTRVGIAPNAGCAGTCIIAIVFSGDCEVEADAPSDSRAATTMGDGVIA